MIIITKSIMVGRDDTLRRDGASESPSGNGCSCYVVTRVYGLHFILGRNQKWLKSLYPLVRVLSETISELAENF